MNSENNSAGNEALKTFEITYELSIIEGKVQKLSKQKLLKKQERCETSR